MDNTTNLLITLSDRYRLLKVAIKINTNTLNSEEIKYWGDDENKIKIFDSLPPHCQTAGNIVDVEEIFEINPNK